MAVRQINFGGTAPVINAVDPNIAQRRQLAELLLARQLRQQQIRSPGELGARLGAAALRQVKVNKEEEAEKEQQQAQQKALAAALAPVQGSPVGPLGPQIPTSRPKSLQELAAALSANPATAQLGLGVQLQAAQQAAQPQAGFSLGPGQTRFSGAGQQIANVPAKSKLLSPEEEAQQKRMRAAGATNIQVGPQGQPLPDAPAGMTFGFNEDGSVATRTDPDTGTEVPVLVPLPGGPVAEERTAAESVAEASRTKQLRTATEMTEDINRLFELSKSSAIPITGLSGAVGKFIPGTPQRDAAELLEGIKANIGFDALQKMRESSPTGGALGQITERELSRLEAVRGSLAQEQREEQFEFNLNRVRDSFMRLRMVNMSPAELAEIDPNKLTDTELDAYIEVMKAQPNAP